MTGVDHPTFEPHMHTPEKIKDEREIGKSNQTATTKSVNRMPVFSVKGQSSYDYVFASIHISKFHLEQDICLNVCPPSAACFHKNIPFPIHRF